jgi:hypothetical protein
MRGHEVAGAMSERPVCVIAALSKREIHGIGLAGRNDEQPKRLR